MNTTYKRGKKYIEITAAVFMSACLFGACADKKELPEASYAYGPELGFASGNVDLSSDSPDINISDIKSPVGENIDFLSGVTVINEDQYEDLEVWADASTIDIFTPGTYTVTYTFKFNDTSISKDIKVTIFEPDADSEPELSEGSKDSAENNKHNNTNNNINTGNDEAETTISNPNSTTKPSSDNNPGTTNKTETVDKNQTSKETETTKNTQGSSKPENTTSASSATKPIITTKPNTTTKPAGTTKPNDTTKPASTTTKKDNTTREIITTTGNKTTSNKYIGNYTIELLSGKTITVKNSTSKYIVSTRTETSEITKNGAKYKVSKLIIRYNTGSEQILEVVEEKIR